MNFIVKTKPMQSQKNHHVLINQNIFWANLFCILRKIINILQLHKPHILLITVIAYQTTESSSCLQQLDIK